jgi:ABC-2 type transport system ATP-binding protein
VLLSSHILAEVEKLCDRVTIIRQGRAVQTGTLDEMRHLTRTSISVATEHPITGLDTISGVHDLAVDDGHVLFDVDAGALDDTIRHLSSFGIRSLVSQPPTLEELFLRHYGDEFASANRRQERAEP